MKRAVICVSDPWNHINRYQNYSLMIVNPGLTESRMKYLLAMADWSLLVTDQKTYQRQGATYTNEKVLWYTSGTTGDSKFYPISQEKIDYVCDRIINDYQITQNDRYVGIMPLWHAHGQIFYWSAKKVGHEANFLPATKITQLENYSPTFLTAIPDMLKVASRLNLKDLRFVRSASSALPNSLYYDLSRAFDAPIIEAFGMTESTSHCFTNPLNGEQRVSTIGLPSGIDADIKDGRLHIKGPAVVENEWFDTGDLAEVDDKGYYRILGRSLDTINIRGYKVNPVSVEYQLLSKFPDIGQCVVFGTNKLKCLYTGDIDASTVGDFLCSLSSYCKPSMIERVEKITLNSMGKISRSMLNQQFQ